MRRKARRNVLGVVWRAALLMSSSGKRVVDFLLALVTLFLLAPVFLMVALSIRACGKHVFTREARIGRWGVPFWMIEFNAEGKCGRILDRIKLRRLPVLLNIMRGDLSWVGPRPMKPGEISASARAAWKRSSIRPGLLSLWWLRQRANIDFGTEIDVDMEYVDEQGAGADLGIALRSLPAMLYGASPVAAPDRIEILGVPVRNFTMEEALQFVLDATSGASAQQLCFVNTDCVNKAQHDPGYAQRLRGARAVLADGIGIRLAGMILRQHIRQNVNGTDLFPLLCCRLQGSEMGIFLLGARPGIAEAVAGWARENYPGVRIKGVHHGFFKPEEENDVIREINASGAEILLVAFGAPKQDMWIASHLPQLRVGVAMGVGGLFDFYSGQIARAPQWLRELSLEWTYRLYQEPGRMWKRYLVGNFVFLSRVLMSAIFRRSEHRSATALRGE